MPPTLRRKSRREVMDKALDKKRKSMKNITGKPASKPKKEKETVKEVQVRFVCVVG